MSPLDKWQEKIAIFRSRFVCREDIFSFRREFNKPETDPTTGGTVWVPAKQVMLKCSNYEDKKLCLIVQKKDGKCRDCTNQVHEPLSDTWLMKHLNGESEIILYMLKAEGIRFGCADFDKGNTLEDAKLMRSLSLNLGIDCYIAKSTSKGYHLYWFFEDFVQAHVFNSFIRHLYEQAGFYERFYMNPEVGMPEVFPKQVSYDDKKIGNGIKVPMMEPRVREGRNCWMSDHDTPIPVEEQYEFLKNTKLISVENFNKVLEEQKIEILAAPASRNKQQARRMNGIAQSKGDDEDFTPFRPIGKFWNVVEGCPAMREYWAKNAKGEYIWDKSNPKGLFNAARVASMNIALSTTDGEAELKKRWNTSNTDNQIGSAKAKGYLPVTCRWMQDNCICNKKKHPKFDGYCLKKIKPVEIENGVRVEMNIPEEEWPEPSPIRFANDNNLTPDDVIQRFRDLHKFIKEKDKYDVKIEIDQTNGQPIINTPFFSNDPIGRQRELVKRVQYFVEADRSRIENVILSVEKLIKKSDYKEILKSLGKEMEKEQEEKKNQSGVKNFVFDNLQYFEEENGYVMVGRDAKGNRFEQTLTNFTVTVEEEVVTLELKDGDDLSNEKINMKDREYTGFIKVNGQKINFRVNHDQWGGSADNMFKTLTKIAGGQLFYKKANADHIRICTNGFNRDVVKRKRIDSIGFWKNNEKDVYVMPKVVVYKDEIRENDEFILEHTNDVAKGLNFKIISKDELKALSIHIIKDYFNCNTSIITMTAFAHAMASSLIPLISRAVSYNKCPILWLSGGFGGGKTFVVENAQFFFGQFEGVINAMGTIKAKMNAGSMFRHSLLVIDDFKRALQPDGGREFNSFIQGSYDRGGRIALQRSGKAREHTDKVRGLVAVTGEEFMDNDASSVSRLILVDAKVKENREHGKAVLENRHMYCGFTPYLIQFAFQLTDNELKEMWDRNYAHFYNDKIAETYKKESAGRVCENLTLNMLAFELTMKMMVAHGAIPETTKEEQCRIHKKNLEHIRTNTFKAIESAKGSEVFLDGLRELLQNPQKFMIEGWPGYSSDEGGDMPDTRHSVSLGFWKRTTPDIVYIYGSVAMKEVGALARGNNTYLQSTQHVGRQLSEEGLLVFDSTEKNERRYTCQIKGPNGVRVRVWPLKAEALGLLVAVKEAKAPVKNYANVQKTDDKDFKEEYF